jgi:hypothetical protein
VPKGGSEATVELVLPANLRPGTWTFTINGAGQVAGDYGRPADPKRPKANNVRQVYPSNPIVLTK